ncbi:MAG: rSAM/selenodomain-associated transferase 2 [Alcanivorax sp.]
MISFVIPTLNEGARIKRMLQTLAQDYPGAERIVVDGGSSDGTVAEVLASGAVLLRSDSGRARQMNLGADAASGDYIFFVHADTCPPTNPQSLTGVLDNAPQWGFFRIRLSGDGVALRVIEGCINLRSRLTRVATGDQMLFVRADLFARLGGFAPIPLMEDVELSKRLRRTASPAIIVDPVETSSRRWRERGIMRTVLQMWALRLAYFCGVHPDRLWRRYYGER